MKKNVLFILIVFLSFGLSAQKSSINSCVCLDSISNQSTPEQIYKRTDDCLAKGDFTKAAHLFALGSVFGEYDVARVRDSSSHVAIMIVQINAFSNMSKENSLRLEEAYQKEFAPNSPELATNCQKIKQIGHPVYHPSYMVSKGKHPTYKSINKGLIKKFDPEEAFRDAMVNVIGCQ